MESINKNDFVEIKFSGYSDGKVFDSNVGEDLKKLNPEAKPSQTIVIVGQGMIVPGLDKSLEGKEVGKDYEVKLTAKEGFGERDRNLVKIIPLKAFTEKNVYPQIGMVFAMDNYLVKILAVSGARVTADFNNPLAGKDLVYKIKIVRKVEDIKEKTEFLFNSFLRMVPEFEIKEDIIVKGPRQLEVFVHGFKDKFKELLGKDLKFEVKEEEKKPEKIDSKVEAKESETKSE
ncbi:MAG: FKBP-type peptidyl-prolyl cis-trans isomerase [Nanoarchaeota archaeon]|nr:FKBP-type peptidyl-prolyl cis-trans isomerase [Nanoarchaeota archaeon]